MAHTASIAIIGTGFAGLGMAAQQVPNDALRTKLPPADPIGCKRILLSNEYYASSRCTSPDATAGVRGTHPPARRVRFPSGTQWRSRPPTQEKQ
ncbi:hypothetical protein [Streptomyces hokutonensis]|uniref:hypothetical protein n=1 Tax=Streptomyces hokutonensis TaxID=1306990 RepID=UPI0034022E5E